MSSRDVLLGCGLLAALIAAGCQGSQAVSVASERPDSRLSVPLGNGAVRLAEASLPFVEVEAVTAPERAGVVRAPGRVTFRDGAVSAVGAPAEGRVTEIHVKVGDAVSQGDALVTLASPVAAATRADLERLMVAESAAQAAAARQAQMLEQGVGVRSEKLAADTHLAEVQADLARARRAVAFLGEGSGESVVVRAPIEGKVLQRLTSVGASVTPGNGAMIEIGNPTALWVVADVFERDLPLIRPGAPASVQLASEQKPVRGHVASLGTVVNSNLRAAPVYVALEEKLDLRPGMYARTTIESISPAGVLLPATAVLIKGGTRSIVYVETEEHTFTPREISVGNVMDGLAHVLTGLQPGDRVVVRGALLLDGAADQLL